MIEEDLLLVILDHPATLDPHHHVIGLVPIVVTIIPLLLKEGNIQDLPRLKVEGTVEKDHIHIIVERGHPRVLHPITVAQGAEVRVRQRAQPIAEVQPQTVMLGNWQRAGPQPVRTSSNSCWTYVGFWILFDNVLSRLFVSLQLLLVCCLWNKTF